MPRLTLTQHLQRYVAWSPKDLPGDSVAAVLEAAYAECPALRGYLVDEHGSVRKHVTIYINGKPITDRERLTDAVGARQEVFVMQALSGG